MVQVPSLHCPVPGIPLLTSPVNKYKETTLIHGQEIQKLSEFIACNG